MVNWWWWVHPGQQVPTRGKVAGEGENDSAKGFEAKIKFQGMTWKNPHPKKWVVSLDYVAAAETGAAPFCVAITAEDR